MKKKRMAVKRTAGKPCNEGTEKRGKDTQKRTMDESDRVSAVHSSPNFCRTVRMPMNVPRSVFSWMAFRPPKTIQQNCQINEKILGKEFVFVVTAPQSRTALLYFATWLVFSLTCVQRYEDSVHCNLLQDGLASLGYY